MRLVKTTQETPTLGAGPASGRVARPSLLCTFPMGTLDKYTWEQSAACAECMSDPPGPAKVLDHISSLWQV